MPQPTAQQVHVDQLLSNISVAYLQDNEDYVADKIFPTVPVQHQSNIVPRYNRGDFFRDTAALRAPGTESTGDGYNLDNTLKYFCDVYATHKMVDPQIRANQDVPYDVDRDATIFVTQKLGIKREIVFLANYFKTGIWTGSTTATDITPGTKWDVGNSTPIEDLEAQQFHVKSLTSKWANRLLLGANAYLALKNHAEVLDRIKYTQFGAVTTGIMASILAPPNTPEGGNADDNPPFKIVVASAVYNTAAEGATDAMGFMATKTDALLCYANPNPGILQPSAGYIFVWTPVAGLEARIRQIPMPWLGIDNNGMPAVRVEAEISLSCEIIASDLGAYFSAATS